MTVYKNYGTYGSSIGSKIWDIVWGLKCKTRPKSMTLLITK